jgi:LDH2 family malate/lactate/ureidoglycolate dehydrogenase
LSTGVSSGAAIRGAAKEDGKLAEGVAVDESGRNVLDAKVAQYSAILPFGGAKGYCLGLMVEIMAGVLTGSGISHEVGSIYLNFERVSNAGHAFLALDIARMMPIEEFYDRMERLTGFIKSTVRSSSVDEILIPGEKRWRTFERQSAEGIDLQAKDADSLAALAKELNLCPPW